MKTTVIWKVVSLLSLVVILNGPQIVFAETIQVSGHFEPSYTQRHVLGVPQTQGHVLMLTMAEGVNRDTSKTGYMDGAKVKIHEILDLHRGNGFSSGYVSQTMPNGDEVLVKIAGIVSTNMSGEGKPQTSFSGNWQLQKGAGEYEGISGSGTYKGYFTGETDFIVDWKGYYSMP